VTLDPASLLVGAALAAAVLMPVLLWLAARGRAGAVAQGRAERDAEVAELAAQRRGVEDRLADAERRRAELEAQVAELNRRVAALAEERGSLAARVDRLATLESKLTAAAGERDRLAEELGELRLQITQYQVKYEAAAAQASERLTLLTNAREQLGQTFRALAAEILDDKSRRFTEQNATQIGTLLDPLREQLKEFRERVAATAERDHADRAVLRNEIDALKKLNAQIGADAKNLAQALKGDTRTQGAWGELVLDRLLEASGLQKGREYEVQRTLREEDGGRPRPDVIVRLPEGRHLIIDAKVSLTAYERRCAASDDAERERQLALHLASMRTHVKALAERRYADLPGVNSLEFVLMFVPVEAAFIEAVRHDDELYAFALERQVVIVTTSTLLATLRTVSSLWRFDDRNRNAIEIADKAGALYDKFVGFVTDLEEAGRRVDAAQRALQDARSKLSSGKGNLVRRAEELKKLGAKAAKALPEGLRGDADDAGTALGAPVGATADAERP
jgi:DNA recombination protein RmuC